jgi:hypothetical protein
MWCLFADELGGIHLEALGGFVQCGDARLHPAALDVAYPQDLGRSDFRYNLPGRAVLARDHRRGLIGPGRRRVLRTSRRGGSAKFA